MSRFTIYGDVMNNVLLEVKDLETSLKINNEWLATVENISLNYLKEKFWV